MFFSGPKGIAVNRSGHLVVVDNRASCILVFQPNGKLVQKFGSRGSEPNKFAGPHFVAIDSQDHIIISDFHNHSIKVKMVEIIEYYFFCSKYLDKYFIFYDKLSSLR